MQLVLIMKNVNPKMTCENKKSALWLGVTKF